jgi:hypothetical protein
MCYWHLWLYKQMVHERGLVEWRREAAWERMDGSHAGTVL